MIFLNNDKLKGDDEMSRKGDNYMTDVLKTRSVDLPYLRAGALVGEFKGVNAFMEYNAKFCKEPRHEGASSNGMKLGFTQFNSFEEATDVFVKNPASIRNFSQKDDLISGGEESGKTVEYDITGDYIDIDRYIEGVPEVFGSMTDGNPRARRVWIIFNEGWLAGVRDEVINARSSRIVRLVDWLESQQIRTQVTGIASNVCGHQEITVKEFDEPLNLNDIAVITHSDFHRRQVFRHREYSDTFEYGYGNTRDFSGAVTKKSFEPQYNTEYCVFIDTNVYSALEVNSDFDKLEALLAEVLVDDNADVEKRSVAILR